jgi:ligand-binding sensor domain-containing protein
VLKRTLLIPAVLALVAAACGGEAAPATTALTTTTGATFTTLPPSTTVDTVSTTTATTTTTAPPETGPGWMAWAASNLGDNQIAPPPCGGCTGGDSPVERWRPIVFVDTAGVVWANETGGLVRWDPAAGTYEPVRGLLDPSVFAAARAADGTLWLATYAGANTFDGDRFAVGLTTDDGLKGETTWDVWAQSNGIIWVTTNQGYILSAWDGTALRHFSDAATADTWGPGIEAVFPEWTQFNSAAEAPDGTMWFGTSGNGLFSFDGAEWRRYTEADGLPSGSVEGVAFTADGTLWLDVIGGLVRFDGSTFAVVDPAEMGDWQGEYPEGLAVGPDGALWVLANQGVFRFLDGAWEFWAEADGMTFGDTASLTIGEDGSVWIADMYGLARYGDNLP